MTDNNSDLSDKELEEFKSELRGEIESALGEHFLNSIAMFGAALIGISTIRVVEFPFITVPTDPTSHTIAGVVMLLGAAFLNWFRTSEYRTRLEEMADEYEELEERATENDE